MKTMMTVFAGLAVALTAQAGPVDVPNSFQGGARALASEVNANFEAVEAAVDDNAARIETLEGDAEAAATAIEENAAAIDDNTLAIGNNADNIAGLQVGLAGAGLQVQVSGETVGRFRGHGFGPVEVDVSGSGGADTELAAQRTTLATAATIGVISPTGYFFSLSTSSEAEPPFGPEGTLVGVPLFFESSDCTGQAYAAVEGSSGLFSTFARGTSDNPTLKRWYARQGFAFHSPDPTAGEAYMVPRGQMVQQVTLNSLYLWSNALGAPNCLDLSLVPGHSGNEINSTVRVEPLDSVETGIAADMAGEITIGL